MSVALRALLQRSCQLADLDAVVARANERLAELRTRKPYPRARGCGAGRAAGAGGEGEECGDAGGWVMAVTNEQIMESRRIEKEFRATELGAMFCEVERLHQAMIYEGERETYSRASQDKYHDLCNKHNEMRSEFRRRLMLLRSEPSD